MPRQLTPVIAALIGAAAITLAGCRHDDESKGSPHIVSRDTAVRPLAAGDVRITSVDSSIELAVIGDSVVGGFGKKVLDEIKEKTDTNDVAGSGFGASIEKLVKTSVAGALSKQMEYPIASIRDVKYEDGRLEFYAENGSRMRFFENKHDSKPDSANVFRPDDAKRFIDAFHARKSAAR